MSEVLNAQGGESQPQFLDPELQDLQVMLDDHLGIIGDRVDDLVRTNKLAEELDAKQSAQVGIAGNEIDDARMEVIETVANAFVTFGGEVGVVRKTNLSRVPLAHERKSMLTLAVDALAERNEDSIEPALHSAIGLAFEDANSSASRDITTAAEDVHSLTAEIDNFWRSDSEIEPGSTEFETLTTLLERASSLPAGSALKAALFDAYVDALKASKDPDLAKRIYGDRKSGMSPMVYRQKVVTRAIDSTTSVMPKTEIPATAVRRQILGHIAGASLVRSSFFVYNRKKIQETTRTTSSQLMVNACEVVQHVLDIGRANRFATERIAVGTAQKDTIMGQEATEVFGQINELRAAAYDVLLTRLNDEGVNEQSIQDIIDLETYFTDRMKDILPKLAELPFFEIELDPSLQSPHIEDDLRTLQDAKEGSIIDQAVAGIHAELEEVQKPYTYSSSAIRKFKDGVRNTRDLGDELNQRKALQANEKIVQTLSMLMHDFASSDDQTDYLQNLKQTLSYSEMLENDLRHLHAGFNSTLVSALHWIDELVDSGEDAQIKNKMLTDFINAYYVGVEETEEQTPAIEPNDEKEDTDRIDRERKQAQERLEKYFEGLRDIMEHMDLEYADIDVFPPGSQEHTGIGSGTASEARFLDIDPERLLGLARLKSTLEATGKTVQLIATNPTRWTALPYFALFARDSADTTKGICILENPVNGHANYIIEVDGVLVRDWKEIAGLPRKEARNDYGAQTRMHPTRGSAAFAQHYDAKLQEIIVSGLHKLRNI